MRASAWDRNTAGLIAHARRRKEQALDRVDAAISTLLREGAPVNFNSVSKEAGVTKQYLYVNAPVRSRIEALRDQHRERTLRERRAPPPGKTETSKDLVILAKDRRIKDLEEEVRRLKKDLQVALGTLYDRI